MAKITINGKDRTTPFTWNGKQVVKITVNGKTCTLTPTGGGGTPTADPCTTTHSESLYFRYAGTWPQAHIDQIAHIISARQSDNVIFREITGVTAVYLGLPAMLRLKITYMPDLVCLDLPNLEIIEAGIDDVPKLSSLKIPKAKTIGDFAFANLPSFTVLESDTIERVGWGGFMSSPLTVINLPKLWAIGYGSQYHWTPFKAVVNAPTTTVTLRNKWNTSANKDKLFGAGNWDQITFTWV